MHTHVCPQQPRQTDILLRAPVYNQNTTSATRMNTVLVRYGYSLRTKQYTKNPNAKYEVKASISMKTTSFNDSAKRSTYSAG